MSRFEPGPPADGTDRLANATITDVFTAIKENRRTAFSGDSRDDLPDVIEE